MRELTGLALARTNPMVLMVARTIPAWDQAGLAIWVISSRPGNFPTLSHALLLQTADSILSTAK